MNMSAIFELLGPELVLLVGATAVLLMGIGSPRARGAVGPVALGSVFLALVTAWYNVPAPGETHEMVGIRINNLVWYIRLVSLGIGLLVLLLHWHLPGPGERGDIFGMILFSLIGILLTAAADDLVVLFLAVELVSVPTYVLVSIGRSDIRAQEAGLKYFFLGAFSAGLLVYGFSFLYGATGTTALSTMSLNAAGGYATIGLLLAFAGVAFKIAAVPFHMYAADVYQGAASPVTGLLGFFPKIAGFVALLKLMLVLQPAGTPGWNLPGIAFAFLWIVSVATMTIGNVLGLMQTNVKRMLAYSSIAHTGYILIAVLVGPASGVGTLSDGISAMLFYIVAYGVMNLGAFAVLTILQSGSRAVEELSDLAGLHRRRPAAALALAICVFSLLGMPPTAGFFGKVYVFMSALSAGPEHPYQSALIWLAVIGFLNSAIGAAYYLRLVAVCYLGDEQVPTTVVPRSGPAQLALLWCCMIVLFVGLWPQGLMRMSRWPSFDHTRPPALVRHVDASPPSQQDASLVANALQP